MSNSSGPSSGQNTVTLPVSEEVLAVSTRLVDTGRGVRIHKTVQSGPVHVDETLVQDEIDVQHIAIDRTLDQGEALPATRYEGDVLIIPVCEEILVVERRMRLKEELHVTRLRRETSHTETVMLKTEHVSIERFDDSDGT